MDELHKTLCILANRSCVIIPGEQNRWMDDEKPTNRIGMEAYIIISLPQHDREWRDKKDPDLKHVFGSI